MARRVLDFPVLKALNTNRISIASLADFVRGRAAPVAAVASGAFPYCLDFLRARALYVPDIEARAVQGAPFYYLHLRRKARSLVSVPIEFGTLSTAQEMRPVFLFSPGRCGSTLLSRILFEAGVVSVSEPDFYTQMSSVFWSNAANPLRARFHKAMWNMTGDLVAALGARHAPVIKLRAECCRAPELFLQPSTGRQRTLVMFRSFESWARSTGRAFRAHPGKAVRKYMRSLECYAFLAKHSDCHVVRYEALHRDPASECAALGRFLGTSIPPDAVARATARDSQEDTPLERDVRPVKPGWETRLAATLHLWHSPRFTAARGRLGVPNVWSGDREKSLRTML